MKQGIANAVKVQNYDWVDSLRVFATFSVIMLHVAAGVVSRYGKIPADEWWTANFYDSIVRFCVPIFLMISGTVIFSKTYVTTIYFLHKRLSKIILPFLFWSFIYICKDIFFQFLQGENLSINHILSFIVKQFRDGASIHLWFVYMIIGLYLLFPIVGKWIQNSHRNDIEYFLLLWITIMVLNMLGLQNLVKQFHLIYFSGFIGYPVLGYYLTNYTTVLERKPLLFCSAVFGISITILGTFILTKNEGSLNGYFYNYLIPNVLLVSCAVFLYFKNWVRVEGRVETIIKFLSRYSYGIYLVHIFVLWFIESAGLKAITIHPIIGIPFVSILCLGGSALIIYILHKIPFGRYVAG